jgi:hypothetical protein
MNRHLFLLFYVFLLISCNQKKLKLDEANKQLVKYFESKPNELFGTNIFEAVIKGKDSGYNNILFRQYIGSGLLKLKEKIIVADTPIYIYQITEANIPYLIKTTQSKNGYPIYVVKTFDYYIDKITDIKYSPDKKEAVAKFTLAIRNLTPFGKDAADPNHKMFLLGFFKFVNQTWQFDKIEPDYDKY